MIQITNIDAFGFEGAIRGMRMPYESFDKSDSLPCLDILDDSCEDCEYSPCPACGFHIGKADMALCKKLIAGGSEHRKFLRMIHVQADVLAPRYWWAEMDKYKWVEANSSSTMHLIAKRHLNTEDFTYNRASFDTVKYAVDEINHKIDIYKEITDEADKKVIFRAIKHMLPESYNQLRTIDTNYECLLSIYHQRKNHRLSEWHEFCDWIKSLPYMKEFLEAAT